MKILVGCKERINRNLLGVQTTTDVVWTPLSFVIPVPTRHSLLSKVPKNEYEFSDRNKGEIKNLLGAYLTSRRELRSPFYESI